MARSFSAASAEEDLRAREQRKSYALMPGFGEDDEDDDEEETEEEELTKEEAAARRNAKVAAGKVILLLMSKSASECVMQKSVYDAAMVIPQICRSADWPVTLLQLTFRQYIFLMLNLFLQCFILYMICQEALVMDKFASKMHLCDFGASVQNCPEGQNCIGPAGTNYVTPGRMYNWDVWQTRSFVRDSLIFLMPDKKSEILDNIDPGEYGLENYWIRVACVFIFMMNVMNDLTSSIDMISILWAVPSKAEMWLEYKVPQWSSKSKVKEMCEKSELDFVKFRIAGMPFSWKVVNFVVIIIPKLLIWRMTATNGVTFLMETSGIQDTIINVTALTFILNLDEMMFELFSHKATWHIMNEIQSYALWEPVGEDFGEEECCKAVDQDKKQRFLNLRAYSWKALLTVCLTVIFIIQYYWTFCERDTKGGWVSRPQHLPKDEYFPLSSFLFPIMFPQPEGELYWTMPDVEDVGR